MTKREQFIQWLGEAHVMELGIASKLEEHIQSTKVLPGIRSSLVKHLTETRNHASEMKKAFLSLGGSYPVFQEDICVEEYHPRGLSPISQDTCEIYL